MEPMSGVEPLPYLVMNYAVLYATFFLNLNIFNNLFMIFRTARRVMPLIPMR